MASEVDICNLALGYLGDAATLASIDPPEGSAQADHCATFYPVARDALLEMHDWGFATKRVLLAPLTSTSNQWQYCYAAPTDLVNTIAVISSDAQDDNSVALSYANPWGQVAIPAQGTYSPVEFVLESLGDGTDAIYTNQENALLRYVARVTDTTKFSPLFIRTLAASLASMLAGPVLKGEAGMRAAAQWEAMAFGRDGMSGLFGKAAASDAGQKRTTTRERQNTSWLAGR